jgi:hypothetical protein
MVRFRQGHGFLRSCERIVTLMVFFGLLGLLGAETRNPVKEIAIAILLFSPLALAAGGPNPSEYTVNVHVCSSSMDPHGNQLLDVVIDGKKYELKSELAIGRLLALGDFKAKLVTNHKTAYESFQVYEFLFPDKTRQYDVVGQTE